MRETTARAGRRGVKNVDEGGGGGTAQAGAENGAEGGHLSGPRGIPIVRGAECASVRDQLIQPRTPELDHGWVRDCHTAERGQDQANEGVKEGCGL